MTLRTCLSLLALLSLPAAAHAHDSPALAFKDHGFSIKPLRSKSATDAVQAVTMNMAPKDGFSPNVNVQVQPYPGTLDEYLATSKSQFASLGFQVVTEKRVAPNTVVLEYKGTMQGHTLHWYARAIKSTRPTVYLVTATAAEAQWAGAAAALKECVDSLKVD